MNQLLQLVKTQQQRLEITLDRVCRHFRMAFSQLANTLHQQALKADKQTMQQILAISLPFSDKSKHLRQKLNNTMECKQILMNSQMELAKNIHMTEQEQQKAKINFDLICDYKKRREMNINGKDLYSLETCKHLAKRTFKKTAVAVYELLSGTQLQLKEPIRIGCLGGGPASDLLGVLTSLVQRNYTQFECLILDFNWDKWQQVSHQLDKIFIAQCKKIKKDIHLTVQWKKLDLADKHVAEQILKYELDIVTCCWALNEQIFHQETWTQLVSCKKTFYLIIDGDQYPIQHVADICSTIGRKHLFCPYQNPRSLMIFQQ